MYGQIKSIASATITSCLLMLVAVPASAQECGDYEVTTVIVGPQCGGFGLTAVVPQALSDAAVVVGYIACLGAGDEAFYWSAKDGLQYIPMPDGTNKSQALAISGSKIVGLHAISGDEFGHLGFLYDYDSDEFTSLGTFKGGNWSEAHDINSSGQIAGYWGNNIVGPWQAFLWENGKMIDLGPSIGGANNRAFGINETGAITGWRREDGGEKTAFVWEDGKVTELPFIPGGFTSEGKVIDCTNRIAGCGRRDEGDALPVTRAFLWDDGEMIDLGTLPGFLRSAALSIRSSPLQIVGQLWDGSQGNTDGGFIWQNGVMSDVQDFLPGNSGLDLSDAVSINQKGQILSRAHSDPLDAAVGVVLTPVQGPLGDLDGDCIISVPDLLILFANWGQCEGCLACAADLDGNGIVSVSDLLILFSNWG